MARYSGKNLAFQWHTGGGTVTLHTNYRTWTVNESADEIDAGAGADAAKTFLAGPYERSGVLEFLPETAGTATYVKLAVQTDGTVVWGPEGSTTGKEKRSATATILGRDDNYSYNQVATLQIRFRLNSVDTVTTW